jgi:hypothetical protein
MEQNLHLDGRLDGTVAGWRAAVAALLLAGLSLVFCALIIEAGLRASAARAALPAVAAERTGGWLADHSVFYQALRQRVSEQGALYQQVRQRLGHAVERVARPG